MRPWIDLQHFADLEQLLRSAQRRTDFQSGIAAGQPGHPTDRVVRCQPGSQLGALSARSGTYLDFDSIPELCERDRALAAGHDLFRCAVDRHRPPARARLFRAPRRRRPPPRPHQQHEPSATERHAAEQGGRCQKRPGHHTPPEAIDDATRLLFDR